MREGWDNSPFRIRFAGKEDEIVQSIWDIGLDETMDLLGVKNYAHFIKWIREYTEGLWYPSPLAGIKGGDKTLWLKQHRSLVLDCLQIFNRRWVQANFCLKDDTFDRFIQRDDEPMRDNQALTRLQRAEMNAREALDSVRKLTGEMDKLRLALTFSNEGWKESRHDNRQLQEAFINFKQAVAFQISQDFANLIRAGLEHSIMPDNSLSPIKKPDPLKIETLLAEGELK